MGKGSSSTPRFVHPVMPRPGGELLLLLLDNGLQVVEILVTTAGVDVDVGGPHVEDALPATPERICGQHGDETEEVEVDLEEVDEVGAAVGGAAVSVRIEPCPDLKDHDDGVEHDPHQLPTTPHRDVKTNSPVSRPRCFNTLRNRMCTRQIDSHVKIEERPDKAIIHEKTSAWLGDAARKPSSPNAEATRMPTNGRPVRSM